MKLLTNHNLKKLIKLIGYLFLIVGLVALYYAPLEIYCYYMFTDIGPLYSEHFNFGTLLFAILVISNISYYLVALFLIPIGIGLIRLHNWVRKLSINLIYICIISVGSTLASFVFSIPKLRDDLTIMLIFAIIIASLITIAISFLFIKLINSNKMVSLFHKKVNLISKISQTTLLIITLNFLVTIVFHISIFIKGIFPLFGRFIFFPSSVHLTASAIFALIILTYLYLKKNIIGLWGMIVYYLTFLISVILTFSKYSTSGIILLLDYSKYENENVLPSLSIFTDLNLTIVISVFITTIIGLTILSKKHFQESNKS